MITRMQDVLRVFERHHLWDQGVELIGSWSFYLYQRHLGVKRYPFRTQDVDFLLPYPYKGRVPIDLLNELEAFGFQRDFRPDGSVYLRSAEFQIDFIVPERGRGMESAAAIPSLGIRAMPLRFVDMLLASPITVVEDGIRIAIPHPAAFCLHKLIVAGRRRKVESRTKDMEQALHMVPILNERDLRARYLKLPKTWQKRILESVERARTITPLLYTEAERLRDTLQKF